MQRALCCYSNTISIATQLELHQDMRSGSNPSCVVVVVIAKAQGPHSGDAVALQGTPLRQCKCIRSNMPDVAPSAWL
eukprot:4205295-Amphidinium_carterae.1